MLSPRLPNKPAMSLITPTSQMRRPRLRSPVTGPVSILHDWLRQSQGSVLGLPDTNMSCSFLIPMLTQLQFSTTILFFGGLRRTKNWETRKIRNLFQWSWGWWRASHHLCQRSPAEPRAARAGASRTSGPGMLGQPSPPHQPGHLEQPWRPAHPSGCSTGSLRRPACLPD